MFRQRWQPAEKPVFEAGGVRFEEHIVLAARGHLKYYPGILCIFLLQQGPWNLHGGREAHCICGWLRGASKQVDLCKSFENQVRAKGVYFVASELHSQVFSAMTHPLPPALPALSFCRAGISGT